jgi:hypothetical protein
LAVGRPKPNLRIGVYQLRGTLLHNGETMTGAVRAWIDARLPVARNGADEHAY